MTIKFMGEQDDPDMDNAEGRGFPRIYDGTKPTLLGDVREFLQAIVDETPVATIAEAEKLLKRIDGGER